MTFNTTDLVELSSHEGIFYVTGVIHDDEWLFVTPINGREFAVDFSDVTQRWCFKDLEESK